MKTKSNIESFDEYQNRAWALAIYPKKGSNWIYPLLGLFGESGEIAEKIKKIIRNDNFVVLKRTKIEDPHFFLEEEKKAMKKELGDVLWYVNAICGEMGWKLKDVAQENIEKLESRQRRNKIKGDGDER